MRFLTIITIFFSFSILAAECPNLTGQFHCMLSDDTYSLLIISQSTISTPSEVELEQYSFNYTSIPGDPDIIFASVAGEPDNFGYINHCSHNRLLSVAADGSSLAELYLDRDKNFVYELNGSLIYKCPRKNK